MSKAIVSKTVLLFGGVLFFFGDWALQGMLHIGVVPSEAIGMGGGFLLMIVGAILLLASHRETDRDEDAGRRDADQAGRGSKTP